MAGKTNKIVKKSTSTKIAAKPVMATSLSSSIAEGKKIYTQYCLSCHQADGLGVQNMNPPLSKTSYVNGDKTRLISIVLKGLGRQEIDGETYTNVMASFNFLNDTQIANLLTFIRNSFRNKSGRISPDEVKVVRQKK
ncbi:MAG: cytochrome c [Ferruginibacter sp.]